MSKRVEFTVGLVTILGLTILIVSIIWGKNYNSKKSYNSFKIRFESVNNIKIGNDVEIRGVKVGLVKDIDLKRNFVDVIVDVEDNVKIYSDASARIVSKELMGGRKLILYPGKSEDLSNGSIKGIKSIGLTESISGIGDTMKSLRSFLDKSETLIAKIDSIIPKKDIDKRFDSLENEFKSVSKSTKKSIRGISNNLKLTLSKFNNITDSINVMLPSITKVGRGMGNSHEKIDNLVTNLDSLVCDLRKKSTLAFDTTGTMGSLIQNRTVYNKLNNRLDQLDTLLYLIKTDGLNLNVDFF
ncbi:MAG: hypothetical protein CR982_02670 [Candidatus Cloacimonadota bacterium]|nr:MAG: hypothetical protein CR982_02670 [Candidatus Cloacimonadota bacterium]PIE79333.1 MAG: hypothetical protein CSA15_03525 [Candidatus Delongbacteria bacterium]